MSLALLHFVFILALMAFVAKGLPTTKQTAIERPILKKSPPTMAAKWPTLAEVITNGGNGIKPSASLLDMLNSPPSSTTTATTTSPLLPAKAKATAVEDMAVAELDIMDFGWNEDNIKLDFITVNDLKRLMAQAGGKLDHSLYAQSATHVGSLSEKDKLELGIITTSTASTTRQVTTTATVVADLTTTTYQKTTTTTQKRRKSSSSTSWLPSVSFNLTSSTTSTTESTPYPPLTLSLGAWQITEEDLPIYVGSAAGVLLLIILLLGVTTWRCCVVPSHSSLYSSSPVKSKDDSHTASPTSRNNNGQQLLPLESTNGKAMVAVAAASASTATQNEGHDSMVCLTGTRVESRIVSPGHHSKPGRTTTLTQRKTTPFDANSSPTEAKCEDELPVAKSPAAGTYVRIPPVDNYVSTSNGATTFHTFHPTTHSRSSNSDKNSSSRSSPDEAGFVSTAGNKGSSLSTPGTVRSTPSSEALDVVADLRYEALRFRSLPLHTPQQQAPRTKETNGNLFNEDEHMMKQYQPVVLNGNTNAQNIEDLYAKVNFTAKSAATKSRDQAVSGQVAVVQPLSLSRCIAQKLSSPPNCSSGSGVMTTFVPKANSNMMTSSTIVTSFDETDEESSIKTFSRMSSEETSSLFYNMKTSL